ncbi:tRNA-binding protein [Robertkochia solimangrovi]|uniref:tRNA-binding protein n=1 Tax=Robertkochia solimangrovi TaxID=2213046 RepID=UPI00117DB221|nr:tRNA-binding protein [Robertkochia solimangrovi]TRZ42749.1 tRNA-binding protein [Robertkochia solimangrovi]
MEEIQWSDFTKVKIKVGTIISAEDFPEARNPAFKLQIDFGPDLGVLKSSAQITRRYKKETLIGKQVVAVVNFPKKQIANMMSECLVIGAVGPDNDVVLLSPDQKVDNGLPVA